MKKFNHVRGVVSTPRYIAPPHRGSNGDSVAETASQSQRRTFGNRFSCLISLPKNFFKKKKKKKKKIDLFTPSPFLHILFINKHTHAPHSRTSHGKLPTKLGPVSFSLYRTLYTTNHFSFLLFNITGKFLSNVQLTNWKCRRRRNVFEQNFLFVAHFVSGKPLCPALHNIKMRVSSKKSFTLLKKSNIAPISINFWMKLWQGT